MRLRLLSKVVLVFILVFSVAMADDSSSDPVNDRLTAARDTFVKDMKRFNEEFEKAIDSKISAARKAGKIEEVDSIKAMMDTYKRDAALPEIAPANLRRRYTVIREKLEDALESGIKAYAKSGNDIERKKIEVELNRLRSIEKIAAVKKELVGTWKATIGNWNTEATFSADGTATESTDQNRGKYTIDLSDGTVTLNWETSQSRWVHKLPLDPKGTASSDSRGAEFKLVKLR